MKTVAQRPQLQPTRTAAWVPSKLFFHRVADRAAELRTSGRPDSRDVRNDHSRLIRTAP